MKSGSTTSGRWSGWRAGQLSQAFSQARFRREERSPHILQTLCRLNNRAKALNLSLSIASLSSCSSCRDSRRRSWSLEHRGLDIKGVIWNYVNVYLTLAAMAQNIAWQMCCHCVQVCIVIFLYLLFLSWHSSDESSSNGPRQRGRALW